MFVADASTTLAWMIPGQATDVSEKAFARTAREFIVVPALWQIEVQNAILKLVRQRIISQPYGDEIRLQLVLLSKRVDGALDAEAFDRVWAIAREHMMTAYDAAYVELAARLDLPLATDDRAVRTAAKKLGVKLL